MTYAEKLQHPNWQRRRLDIMEKAGFACEECDDNKSPLHVHHVTYEKGWMPWDYPDGDLLCLCNECHERLEDRNKALLRMIGRYHQPSRLTFIIYAVLLMGLERFQKTFPDCLKEGFSARTAIGNDQISTEAEIKEFMKAAGYAQCDCPKCSGGNPDAADIEPSPHHSES